MAWHLYTHVLASKYILMFAMPTDMFSANSIKGCMHMPCCTTTPHYKSMLTVSIWQESTAWISYQRQSQKENDVCPYSLMAEDLLDTFSTAGLAYFKHL